MLLKKTAGFDREEAWPIVWEHGRRNFALRADGLVSIILPVADDGELAGLCVFNIEADEVARLMDDDPGVRAGIFTYELHPCLGFPGDALRA